MILTFSYFSAFSESSIISMCSFIIGGAGGGAGRGITKKKLRFLTTEKDQGIYMSLQKRLKSIKRRESRAEEKKTTILKWSKPTIQQKRWPNSSQEAVLPHRRGGQQADKTPTKVTLSKSKPLLNI